MIRWLERADSTNSALAAWAAEGAPDGATVAADEQVAGRGRIGHRWTSPPRLNLAASVLVEADVPPDRLCTLPLLAGLAVTRAILRSAPELSQALAVKWPNDVWCGGRKLCGILCEVAPSRGVAGAPPAVVVGIGINANSRAGDFPPELRGRVATLAGETGREWDRRALLEEIRGELLAMRDIWKIRGLSPFLEELRARDPLAGREIAVESGGHADRGTAAGISGSGELLLRLPSGAILPVAAGDVHVVGT